MDVFTQILNMSMSTKMTPSSVKGKEKEKEEDPLPTLTDIEQMALIAWQQHQSGKKKSHDYAHKIGTVKCNPGNPQFLQQQQQPLQQQQQGQQQQGGNRPLQQQQGGQQKKKTNCGKCSTAGQAKQDMREQRHTNMHSNEAPTASFTFTTTLPNDPIIVSTGPTIVDLCHSAHITGETHYGLPAFPQTKRTISLARRIGVTPTIETVCHLDKVTNRTSRVPAPYVNISDYDFSTPSPSHPLGYETHERNQAVHQLSLSFSATFSLNVPSYENAMTNDGTSLLS